MAFISKTLVARHSANKSIGVTSIFNPPGWWRFMLLVRFAYNFGSIFPDFLMSILDGIFWSLWAITLRIFGKRSRERQTPLPATIHRWNLVRTSRHAVHALNLFTFCKGLTLDLATSFKHPKRWFFWTVYFVYAEDIETFISDYCEAWKLQADVDMEIILFMDNVHRLAVPCSSEAEDKDLMTHLHDFYNLIKARSGLFEFLGVKSSQRIDIVELRQIYVAGKRICPPLNLGKHGLYGRQDHCFRDRSNLTGTDLKTRLISEGVLTPLEQQKCALKIVRSWDSYAPRIIVLLPVGLSLYISITWSAVATLRYGADPQISTQTGFTIGSYVVTAGTLLIALVAFFDTQVTQP